MGARSRALIEESRALIAKARTRIAQAQRRILFIIRGGSTAVAEPDAPAPTISPTMPAPTMSPPMPRVYAGISRGGKRCSRCHAEIESGAPEYEVVLDKVVLLDRKCFVQETANWLN